ncbi:MAG: AIR synthase-related protein [Tissierellia bacterium]|nr:AIR synthase-related protein [Tissierellia bacterium]
MSEYLEIGKLPNELLENYILSKIKINRPEVTLGGDVGQDTAVLNMGEYLTVLSTDPITGASGNLGHLGVNISVNDIATQGAEAVGILLTLLLPPKTTEAFIQKTMEEVLQATDELGMSVVGGHTEITDAVTKPVLVTTVLGKAKGEEMPKKERIAPGYAVCMTKTAGLEGTAILATDHRGVQAHLEPEILREAQELIHGTSVYREGRAARKYRVGYMHDVTEGGIEGAIWEAAQATDWGMEVDKDAIPVHPATVAIGEFLDINIYRLISSGSMLMVLHPEDVAPLAEDLRAQGIPLHQIGTIVEGGKISYKSGQLIPPPGSDELYAALSKLQ